MALFDKKSLVSKLDAVNEFERQPVPAEKLKPVLEVLDAEPALSPELLELARWAADYYQHPIGEVIAAALEAAKSLSVGPLDG